MENKRGAGDPRGAKSCNLFWRDIILLSVSMFLLKGAATGQFYSAGRGGLRTPIAKITSMPVRAAFLFMGGGLLPWVIRDFTQKINR